MFTYSGPSSTAYLDPVVVTFEILFLASTKSQNLSVFLSVGTTILWIVDTNYLSTTKIGPSDYGRRARLRDQF